MIKPDLANSVQIPAYPDLPDLIDSLKSMKSSERDTLITWFDFFSDEDAFIHEQLSTYNAPPHGPIPANTFIFELLQLIKTMNKFLHSGGLFLTYRQHFIELLEVGQKVARHAQLVENRLTVAEEVLEALSNEVKTLDKYFDHYVEDTLNSKSRSFKRNFLVPK